LDTRHRAQIELLSQAETIPGVKHVFVASGIRYDLALEDPSYIEELIVGRHISGTLKVAPEHADPVVLKLMRKPSTECFDRFVEVYRLKSRQQGQPGYLTAYFISTFPGSNLGSMQRLAKYAQNHKLRVEQMQDFIPLPMTLAGVIYHTGLDPWSKNPIFNEKSQSQRQAQRQILLGTPLRTKSHPSHK
jgi:uncharacterized radical SAM protein YgiQ